MDAGQFVQFVNADVEDIYCWQEGLLLFVYVGHLQV